MKNFSAALWTELLKVRRSKVPLIALLVFSILPLVGGLFMVILKDPEAAKSMGLISVKAQVMVGEATWAAYFGLLAQMIAIGGFLLFGVLAVWTFGREFSDRTVKELLALPTPRRSIVWAKFMVVVMLSMVASVWVFGLGLLVGMWVDIPGWSVALLNASAFSIFGTALLTLGLVPLVALFASVGRGYLAPMGWLLLTLILAQVIAYTGWGDYFPWTIPALFSGAAGPRSVMLGSYSYVILAGTAVVGMWATLHWWNHADHSA